MNKLLAQTEVPITGPINGIGPYGNSGNAFNQLTTILTVIIGLLTLIAGIWFIILLITGGIAWMSSGGDKGKLADARSRMMSGAIGLTIVVAALFLAEIFGGLIGFPDILNPAGLLNSISPP
jgi:Type IV secretion system pilin